ncbi:MAG: response regulator [Alteromonadaceae bacterium]|nr:response regulator [Alteromonadaceae bacterium]
MLITKSYLTPNQAAELLMVSPSAIRLWSEKGDLKARLTAGGHRRFKLADIEDFAQQRNIELNVAEDKKVKILIVDDEEMFAELLETVLVLQFNELEFSEAEVKISLNGFDAGIQLKAFAPNIVLLDLMMENIDGFQICQQIKQDPSLKHIRVIAMSGNASTRNRQEIIKAGAEALLEKPINIAELTKQLNF